MGKFIVKETKTGFVFHMTAGNGEVIATSQVYKAKGSCIKGIRSVRVNALAASLMDNTMEGTKVCVNPRFEIYMDKAGEVRFHLRAKNGQIIAVSQAYKEKMGAVKGIESMRKNAAEAVIEEAEPEK